MIPIHKIVGKLVHNDHAVKPLEEYVDVLDEYDGDPVQPFKRHVVDGILDKQYNQWHTMIVVSYVFETIKYNFVVQLFRT